MRIGPLMHIIKRLAYLGNGNRVDVCNLVHFHAYYCIIPTRKALTSLSLRHCIGLSSNNPPNRLIFVADHIHERMITPRITGPLLGQLVHPFKCPAGSLDFAPFPLGLH